MASHAVTGKYVPVGVSQQNIFFVKATLAQALANAETFDITVPAGTSPSAWPVGMICYNPLGGGVYARDADIGVITNHNPTTGVTRITASGDVADASVVILIYVGV